MIFRIFTGYKLKEKPFDESSMEIKTHVLTNEQHLDDNRKAMARKNIDAAKKAVNTHEGNLAGFDANGELVDSGIKNGDVVQGVYRKIEGYQPEKLQPDEHGCVTVVIPAGVDVSGKADKVSYATEGNFAGLDNTGNLTDSGKKAADFATAAQGAKADTAYQKPGEGIPKNDLAQGVQDSLDLADTALQEHQDISGKADKVDNATNGNFAGLDASGNLTDSHSKASDFATAVQGALADTAYQKPGEGIPKNDLAQGVQDSLDLADTALQEHQDISGKADKVDNATNGNFAGLDANGNLTDSHSKASDFATAAQGAKADSAIQGVKVNGGSEIVPDANKVVDIEVDSIVPPENNGEWIWSDEKDSEGNAMGWRQIVRDYVGNLQRDENDNPILDENDIPLTDESDAQDAVKLWLTYKQCEFAARRAYEDETGANIHDSIESRTTMAQVIAAIEAALANYGGFKVVPLVNGVPDPSPDLPSDKFIYLTKEDPSAKTDPYTEWIWIDGTPDGHWDCIGETSIDLTGYWHGAINPVGSGNVVTDVSVDLNSGAVTVTKGKSVADGATKVEASNTNGNIKINGTETTVYAHPTKTAVPAAAVKVGNDGEGHVVLGNALTKADVGLDLVTNQTITVTNTSVSDGTNTFNKYVHPAPSAAGTDTQVGPTQDTSGNSITMPYFTYDSLGHVTGNGTHTHTVPSANDGVLTVTVGNATAKTFSANQSSNESITIPVAQSASGQDPATEGLISATDKAKLDGIEAGAEVNTIESISVNGSAQTIDANRNVDITVPAAANDGELSITVGSARPVTFTANQSTNESVTVPLASKDTSGATPVFTEGLMTSAQNEKLDGIEAGAKVNVIEQINVNGTAQTVTNKTVDITVPAAANDGELSITVGSANAVTFTANQAGNSSVTVPLAAKDTSGATPVYTEGLMTAAQNEKLDGIASGADVNTIESISVNGTAQTIDANKNVDITVPAAANDADLKVQLGSASTATKVFSADASTDGLITVPLASYDDTVTPTTYVEGLMTGEDKEKLDGIEAGAEENDVETISIGGGNPISPTVNTTNIDIPMAAYTSGATPTYTDGAMEGQDKKKLDELKNFSSIVLTDGVTPLPIATVVPTDHNSALKLQAGANIALSSSPNVDPDTVIISAASDPVTVSGGKGINVTTSIDPYTSATDYEVSVSGALGCIGGTSSVNVTATDCDAIALPMTAAFDSGNDRFIIQEDANDHHVYLYALKTVAGQTPATRVDGVDIFTVTFNVNLTRAAIQSGVTQHGFYGLAGIKVLRKHNSSVVLADSSESYAAEVGAASINLTVTIQNNSGTETIINSKSYYGYRFVYYGDVPELDPTTSDPIETIDLVSRLTSIEETVGIAEYNGTIPVYTAGTAIDMTSDVVSVQYNRGLMVNSNNQLEVRLGEGLDYLPDPANPAIVAIGIHNDVEEVVETVNQLETTINTTVTTNMNFADITGKYDLSTDGSSTGNGVLLGYAFTVPLANQLYIDDVANEWVTKIGVYASQVYSQNYCIIGIYEFDFNQHPVPVSQDYPTGLAGYTVPLCDTGRVQLREGLNEFSIKHMNNNSETELSFKPDCIYYAAIYISKNSGQGVSLAGKTGYVDPFNTSLPVMSLDMCNINIDLSDSSKTATELDAISFNDFGWWAGSGDTGAYHECPNAHRFFMMVRNIKTVQSN